MGGGINPTPAAMAVTRCVMDNLVLHQKVGVILTLPEVGCDIDFLKTKVKTKTKGK